MPEFRQFWLYELIIIVTFILFLLAYFLFCKYKKDYQIGDLSKKNRFQKFFINAFSNKEKFLTLINRTFAMILVIVFLFRFYSSHDYIQNVIALKSDFMSEWQVAIGAILICWWVGAILFAVIGQFFNSKELKTIVRFIVTPVTLLLIIFLPFAFESVVGYFDGTISYQAILMGLELGILCYFSCTSWIENKNFKLNSHEVYTIIVGLILFLICTMNDYVVPNLFGLYVGGLSAPMDLNLPHRIIIILAFALPVLYFNLLYSFDIKNRRALLLFISLATFFGYVSIHRYETFTSVPNLPLHLCNLAMYIMPLTLIFKSHFLFYFTVFINVFGALMAMLMPNYDSGIAVLSIQVFEFFINHLYAFFMPVLIMLLGIYGRPKFKYLLYSVIGFLIYYCTVAFIDIYWEGRFGVDIDFFFLNSDFLPDKFGRPGERLYENITVIEVNGYEYTIRVPFLILYFVVYVGLTFVMWFVYEVLFKAVDGTISLHEKRHQYNEDKKAFLKMQKENPVMKKTKDYSAIPATLDIEHLSKSYTDKGPMIVNDFNLHLKGGKIYGFLGKNGAGKSTIIKSIVGMHNFNQGSIKVCGFDVLHETIDAKICLGFVPDHYALYESLTGRQYINYIATLYGVKKEDLLVREKHLVDRLELTKAYDHPIRTYSHGMKQKITIISALIHEPKVWILDEPMTGLDPNSIFQIKTLMKEYARSGNIVFFSNHIIDVVENLCDEIIIIKHGEIVKETSMEELNKNNIGLEKLFLELTADSKKEANKLIKEEEAFNHE
jgi:ABC-2 type transport system ATP-binding protein